MFTRILSPLLPYFDQRQLSILALGVMSGLPWSLTHTTMGYWLSTSGVSMKTIGLFALTSLPYAFKFLWAPLIDRYSAPLIGLGKSGWMILCQLGLIFSLYTLSELDPRDAVSLIALLCLLTSFFSATLDIAVDGWRVRTLSDEEQGIGATAATLGYRLGMYLSSAGALLLSVSLSWGTIYRLLACIIALGGLVALYSHRLSVQSDLEDETKAVDASPLWLTLLVSLGLSTPILTNFASDFFQDAEGWLQWRDYLHSIKMLGFSLLLLVVIILSRRSSQSTSSQTGVIGQAKARWGERWFLILSFICIFRLGDQLLSQFLYPCLGELGFTGIEIAKVAKTWGLIATFLGSFLGGWLVYRVGLMRVMVIAGIAQALSNLALSVQALIGHSVGFLYISIGIQDLALGMVNATFVAYISSLCDRRYAAAHFAFLSALPAVLKTFFQAGSGWVVTECQTYLGTQGGWAVYFALTSLIALPGLYLLWLLNSTSRLSEQS